MKNLVKFPKIESTLTAYAKISKEVAELNKKREELRTLILNEMNRKGDLKLVAGSMVAIASEATRETFDLKTAKAELGERVLKPFLTETTYFRLTVK